MTIRIALYQPDIPQNTGTILRMSACFGVPVDIIEPAGFDMSDRALKRAGMDYLARAAVCRHVCFEDFRQTVNETGRLILFTTSADTSHYDFEFAAEDILLFGRESAGVPPHVHDAADSRVVIPMQPGARSLNLAVSAAIAVAEALRQIGGFPSPAPRDNSRP